MLSGPVWTNLVAPSLYTFALIGSAVGIVVGIGLVFGTASTLQFFHRVNRKVSMRQALKPMEIPRSLETPGARHPVLGVLFLLGGAFVAFALLTQLDAAKTVAALGIKRNLLAAAIAVGTARWFLVAGAFLAIVSGVMMLFFPAAWQALERRSNKWYSTRQMMAGADEMHFGLDRLVEAFPRAAGTIIGAASLISTAAFAILLFVKR